MRQGRSEPHITRSASSTRRVAGARPIARPPGGTTMAEAKMGEQFVTHELDEAIAIQRAIVDAEEKLGKDHPRPQAQQLIKSNLESDRKFLQQLEKLGKTKGATGKAEEVAGS